MKKLKYIFAVLLTLLFCTPAPAVFNEKDLGQTLSVLRYELKREYDKLNLMEASLDQLDRSQHLQMIDITKKCNELALMLYSQNQDYTFDMAYALKEVSREYEEFNVNKMPYDDIVARLDIEIDRYTRLINALNRLPVRGVMPSRHFIDSIRAARADEDTTIHHRTAIDSLTSRLSKPNMFVRDTLVDDKAKASAFLLDDEGKSNRDSCVYYAEALLEMFSYSKERIISDNEHYENANKRLKESYDYAQERYLHLQKKMLSEKQDNYLRILWNPAAYLKTASEEVLGKYSRHQTGNKYIKSEWRGPVVSGFIILVLMSLAISAVISFVAVNAVGKHSKKINQEKFKLRKQDFTLLCGAIIFLVALAAIVIITDNHFIRQASQLLFVFCWLLIAILLSLAFRLKPEKLHDGVKLFIPAITIGFVAIFFRIMFIPNRMMNFLLPPMLAIFLIWQIIVCHRYCRNLEISDEITAWLTSLILAVTCILSFTGYVFLSLLIVMCWLSVLAGIETVITLNNILQYLKKKNKVDDFKSGRNADIRKTWLYDIAEMAIIPIAAVELLPLGILLGMRIFDMQEIFSNLFNTEFFNFSTAEGNEMLRVSARMIFFAVALFFIFKFFSYLIRSIYRDYKYRKIFEAEGKRHISSNEVNLTLARNVISILVWGTYIILVFLLFRIPTGAISIVFAGLATGIGLALKDVLNNFIYGIQLMSGRLRVGDWIECDGIRGKVNAISYQSTQIETVDGAVMSFLNTALFNKNFKNLTRNNPYELVKIGVGISYGTDVDKARKVIQDALEKLQSNDEYGRKIVDSKAGISVVFDDFGDSSVNIAVKQYILVSKRSAYIARAKETIYNALNEAGISIPFPQRDIHIIQ